MRLGLTVLLSLMLARNLHSRQRRSSNPRNSHWPAVQPRHLVGDTLYVAGQTGSNLKTGEIPAEFEAEVRQTLDNIGWSSKVGMTFDNAVTVQVYFTPIPCSRR